MREITITEQEAGQRLDKFLNRYLPEAGSGFLYKMLRKKNIVLNGKKAAGKELLECGDSVKLFFAEETLEKFQAGRTVIGQTPALAEQYIIYEDTQVLIVNKPAGMLSQKAGQEDTSLVEYCCGYLSGKGELTAESERLFRPGVCNRLDRNTSGLVLVGKTLAAARALSGLIQKRTVRKFYVCVADGVIRQPAHVTAWLKKDETTNRVQVSERELPGSDRIETAYEPLADNGSQTLLQVELLTGRTHQIRSHLAWLGHPILGDRKYGDRNKTSQDSLHLKHQLLHAWRLEFPELGGVLAPLSGAVIEAPVPAEWNRILQKLGLPAPENIETNTSYEIRDFRKGAESGR